MGLDKPGRLRVDQPTITGELGPAPDAYTHYSPVMITALSKTAGRSAFDEGGPFFCAKQEAGSLSPPTGTAQIGACKVPGGPLSEEDYRKAAQDSGSLM
jgi:hypothetical protein